MEETQPICAEVPIIHPSHRGQHSKVTPVQRATREAPCTYSTYSYGLYINEDIQDFTNCDHCTHAGSLLRDNTLTLESPTSNTDIFSSFSYGHAIILVITDALSQMNLAQVSIQMNICLQPYQFLKCTCR